jgi:AraC family transcriptional regulator, arabinose operon regulatory protein
MDRRIELVISKIDSDPGICEFSQLAALVNLSPSRLRHLFKQETGTTPAQFLKSSRLRKAEVLVRTGFLTVKEIANQVGLASNSHFVREFRKVYGMSPTVYRKMNGLTPSKIRSRRK